MAYDETIANNVRNALASFKPDEKKAFGGLMFMVHGKMCVSVSNRPDHNMMVRVDPAIQDEVTKRNGAKIAIMRGRQMPGWIFLSNDAIDTQDKFDYWIELAINFNKEITKKK